MCTKAHSGLMGKLIELEHRKEYQIQITNSFAAFRT